MNPWFRSAAMALLFVLGGLPVCSAPLVAAEASKPNVLVILADDLGYSDLGCYGSEIATPNLDQLAAGGLRYTQFYNTARCWPSRGALLTGYYAQAIRRDQIPGVKSGSQGTRPAWAKLLPELLQAAGYRSYHSGKWHVDGQPHENGFAHSYLLNDAGRYFSPKNHFEDGKKLPAAQRDSGYYTTIAIADHAVKCLQEHAAQHAEQPFFQYVCFTAPHFPLHALPEDIARYRDKYRVGWDAIRTARHERQKALGFAQQELPPLERNVGPPYAFPEAIKQLGPGEINRPLPWAELSPEQQAFQAEKMAIHAAMVDRMDREIGRIGKQLAAMRAVENTLVLFVSDNGASAEIMVRDDGHDPSAEPGSAATHLCLGPGWSSAANTPFRRHKTWVHEGGISTPLIAHWPAGIAGRGELRQQMGHVIDLVPTALELAGLQPARERAGVAVPPLPGKSLVASFTRDNSVRRNYLWWLHEGNRALRAGDFKLVAAKDQPWELYDLSRDRGEMRNLAVSSPEKVDELDSLWQQQFERCRELASRDTANP
jgi:arylsulfatase